MGVISFCCGYRVYLKPYLFTSGFQTGDLGVASAIGWLLVVIILTATLLMYLLGVKERKPR